MKQILTISILFVCQLSFSQQLDKNKNYYLTSVGFYNVENLYDTIDSPDTDDYEFLPKGPNNWTGERYWKKLDALAKVISEMGDKTPDGLSIIGLCEIENVSVLKDLVKTSLLKARNYGIVHYDSPDRRGVDVALLYNPKYFEVTSSKAFRLKNPADTSFRSRDQLLVSGKLLGENFHFIVGHWPSRRGGEKRSEPLRFLAANLAKGIIDSLQKNDPEAKVILMGDLNDNPTDKSITRILKAKNSRELKSDELFNPMVDYHNKGIGTLAHNDAWGLFDQLIMTPELAKENCNSFRFYSAKVFNKPYLQQPTGRFQGYPFRTYAGGSYAGGYSDHFPVYLYLIKEKTN